MIMANYLTQSATSFSTVYNNNYFCVNVVAVKLPNISINFAPPSKFRSFSFAAVASAGCWLETAVALDAAAAVRDGVDVLERALVQRAVRRVLARLPLLVDRVHDVNRRAAALP